MFGVVEAKKSGEGDRECHIDETAFFQLQARFEVLQACENEGEACIAQLEQEEARLKQELEAARKMAFSLSEVQASLEGAVNVQQQVQKSFGMKLLRQQTSEILDEIESTVTFAEDTNSEAIAVSTAALHKHEEVADTYHMKMLQFRDPAFLQSEVEAKWSMVDEMFHRNEQVEHAICDRKEAIEDMNAQEKTASIVQQLKVKLEDRVEQEARSFSVMSEEVKVLTEEVKHLEPMKHLQPSSRWSRFGRTPNSHFQLQPVGPRYNPYY